MNFQRTATLFFKAAANVNLFNTFMGGCKDIIEYYKVGNAELEHSAKTRATTIVVSTAVGAGIQFYRTATNTDYSRMDKFTIMAGTVYGEVTSAIIATLSFTMSGFPDPSITFTISNGLLAAIHSGLVCATQEIKKSSLKPS